LESPVDSLTAALVRSDLPSLDAFCGLTCKPYPLRFLFASRPAIMGRVLGIVYRVIATHLIKKAGFS